MREHSQEPRSRLLEREFGRLLAAAFGRAGWKAKRVAADGPDAVVRRGKLRYAIVLKVAREPRRAVVQAMLADAVLCAGAYARALGAEPLAVVAAPRISRTLAAESAEYARRFAPGVAFGLLDARGRFELHGPGLEALGADARRPVLERQPVALVRNDPFSDLGQWIIKVLLAQRFPPVPIGAPREVIDNVSRLAKAAAVSLATASRVVAQLRRLGFIEGAPRHLAIVRITDLLLAWRKASAAPLVEIAARWLLPPKNAPAQLDRMLRGFSASGGASPGGRAGSSGGRNQPRACLGLFAAGAKLGFRFVQGAPLHLYIDDVSSAALEAVGLAAARNGEPADVFVRRPRFPEALFRACVDVDGVPVADVLQCWLDVSEHPARGAEYAEQIWRRVLAPRLLEPQR